jgi:hypothetical protein
MTKGQHKKYYKSKKAGGVREYRVAILIDMSESMKGPHGAATVEGVVAMTSALERMQLTDFSVATFGEEVTVIKADDTPWNAACKHTLLARVSQHRMVEMSSLDSDGVHHAVDLLCASKGAGPMMCFVFTDGYGSRGVRLSRELMRANSLGVMVVGVSMGVEDSFVSSSYQHWINAVNVGSLGDGVAKLFRGDGTGSSRDAHTKRAFRCVLQSDGDGDGATLSDVWSTHVSYYDDVKQRLAQDRTLHLHTRTVGAGGAGGGHTSVDVCFVMDCTGSMGSWISACKQKVCLCCFLFCILCVVCVTGWLKLLCGSTSLWISLAFCARCGCLQPKFMLLLCFLSVRKLLGTHIHTYIYTYIHVHVHTFIRTYIHTHTYTYLMV